MAITFVHKRVRREMVALTRSPPPGVTLCDELPDHDDRRLKQFTVSIKGADETLYAGEEFKLFFKFPDRYPFDPPEVRFDGEHIPVHPHVYSNGHICLSTLTEDWSASHSAESVCLSIISMLSSCKEKKRPENDKSYVRRHPPDSMHGNWVFDDDEC